MVPKMVKTYNGWDERPRARLHEAATAFFPITLSVLVFLLSLWIGFGLLGTAKDGSQWVGAGTGMVLAAVFIGMYLGMQGIDHYESARRRLDKLVLSRPTRFRQQAIRAVPLGDNVEINFYKRMGLLAAPAHSRRTFDASDDEAIHGYVAELRQSNDNDDRPTPEAIAVARVINRRK